MISPATKTADSCDVAVIGGGLVGSSVAYGLAGRRLKTIILDEGDTAYRASRGNFALVWVQSKGMGMPRYAGWSKLSSDIWTGFATDVREASGIDVAYQRPGGFALVLSEGEMERRRLMLGLLHQQPGMVPYEVQFLDRAETLKALPAIGPEVVGATYCALDGHVNSLRLFRALHTAFLRLGGRYLPNRTVDRILPAGGGFRIEAGGSTIEAGKLVLAAGIGNARLAPMVGLQAPVRPQRGQVIVTEKTAPFLHYPTGTIRQTDEGGVMLGDSVEEAGFDAHVGLGVLGEEADRAVRSFPLIGRLNVVRSWAALRVMTPDGFPIYDQSTSAPGAFLCTCHSGVTLAAAHGIELAGMVAGGALAPELDVFSARRFHVSAAA